MTNHNSHVSPSEGEKKEIFTAHWQITLTLLKQDVSADISELLGTKATPHAKRQGQMT